MSQAPNKDPLPPHPTPDSPYELQPAQPPAQERDLTAQILTISIIVSCFVLLGVGAMLWIRDNRRPARVSAPTPTLVAQIIPPPSDTPAPAVKATSGAPTRETVLATPTSGLALPLITGNSGTPSPVSTPSDVHLPAISSDQGASASPAPSLVPTVTSAPTPVPVLAPQALRFLALPYLSVQIPPTFTPAPPAATPLPTSTGAPTAAGTPIGTPIMTPTGVPTGVPIVIDDMQARMRRTADFYVGPSAIYTATDSLEAGVEITLNGRDRTGEWVFACCVDDDDSDDERNDRAWIRQAFVTIEGNELDGEDDEDAIDRNDARWLPVAAARPNLRPLPTVTPPPEGDFPLYRYTPDNRGFLPNLPNLTSAVQPWTTEPEAGDALQTPLIVADSYIYGASQDGHVYSWERSSGSQRARRLLNAQVTSAPAADDGLVYFVDQNGLLHALQDPIDQDLIWQVDLASLPVEPITGINVYSHTLFINMNGALTVIDGEEGFFLHELLLSADPLYPAIGGQLVYVIADEVRAYDALMMIEENRTDMVWERSGIPPALVPPVYTAQGVGSLAELYIAGSNNRIYSLDANTGDENWNDDNEEAITGLAVSDTTLYIAGDGYIKARTRNAPEQDVNPVLWRTPIAGTVLAGPLVGPQYVILILQSGNILFLDAATGEPRGTYPTYPALTTSAGAVSFPYVFAPGQDGKLYGYRQSP